MRFPVAVVVAALLFSRTGHAQPASEVARVRAHLVAARTFVTSHDVADLTRSQRTNRAAALVVLDRYIDRGVFPLRTGDSYAGLRPRFIDSRGVHCAVGEMIAETGHTDLANAINADFEYSFVRDIHSPELLAWAADHGFTVDELARIQPSYSPPPTERGVRQEIEQYADGYMLACASDARPPAKAKIRMIITRGGDVAIKPPDNATAFERCFADAIRISGWGGAMSPSPTPVDRVIGIELRTPEEALEHKLKTFLGFAPQCSPRPGALARKATLSITNTAKDGFAVAVQTEPSNAQTEKCIADYLGPSLREFEKAFHLDYSHSWDLPRMTSRAVEAAVKSDAPGFATDCYVKETAPTKLALAISAKADDKTFTISAGEANADYAKCIIAKLEPALRARFSVKRDVEGKPQRYFRIDAAIQTSVTFTIELPGDRTARLEREKKAQQKRAAEQRKRLEEEMQRRKYEM